MKSANRKSWYAMEGSSDASDATMGTSVTVAGDRKAAGKGVSVKYF